MSDLSNPLQDGRTQLTGNAELGTGQTGGAHSENEMAGLC